MFSARFFPAGIVADSSHMLTRADVTMSASPMPSTERKKATFAMPFVYQTDDRGDCCRVVRSVTFVICYNGVTARRRVSAMGGFMPCYRRSVHGKIPPNSRASHIVFVKHRG